MASKSFVFRFDDVEVREREFTLIKAGKVLTVEPKAFRALLFLLRNPAKADLEGRTAQCRLGRCRRYRRFPDALHLAAAQSAGR